MTELLVTTDTGEPFGDMVLLEELDVARHQLNRGLDLIERAEYLGELLASNMFVDLAFARREVDAFKHACAAYGNERRRA